MPNTNFDTWLQALQAGGKGGAAISMKLATRGLAWTDVVELTGDWADATLEGSISAAPDAPSVLADFTVGTGVYDADDDVTRWDVSLAATGDDSTASLPTDTDGDGIEYVPCAFYLTPDGSDEKELLFGAAFRLTGKV